MAMKVLVIGGPEGHLSIGEAVKEKMEGLGHKVDLMKLGGREVMPYRLMYRYWPTLWKVFYWASFWPITWRLTRVFGKLKYGKKVRAKLNEGNYDLVVSSWFVVNPIVEQTGVRFANVVTDPRSISPVILTGKGENWALDEKAVLTCKNLGFGDTVEMGWWVRERFGREEKVDKLKSELGMESVGLSVLVAAGSEGSEKVKDLFEVWKDEVDLQVIVACGTNNRLKQWVEQWATEDHGVKVRALGFTDEINKWMKVVDIVVGKAGPNMLFEAIYSGKSFWAITHIPGQEDGNLGLIEEYGVGWVEEKKRDMAKMWQKVKYQYREKEMVVLKVKTRLERINKQGIAKFVERS